MDTTDGEESESDGGETLPDEDDDSEVVSQHYTITAFIIIIL